MKVRLLFALFGFIQLTASAQDTLVPARVSDQSNNRNTIRPVLRGAWKAVGNGYLLGIAAQKITLYSYTSRHCYEEKNDFLSGLLNESALFGMNKRKDTVSVYLHDFGKKTTRLQSKMVFVKLPELPQNCSPLTSQQQTDPVFLFDLFWTTLQENYAFTKERNLNWSQLYQHYKPRVSSQTTQNELFDLMGEVVTLTKDHHTKISAEDGKTKQYSDVPTALRLREGFDQQTEVKDFNQYIQQFFAVNYEDISNDLLQGKGKKMANGKLEWGDIDPDIGYIHIHGLAGFASGQLTRSQHVDTLNACMMQIMKAFQHKKAILLDVGFNFGGYDAAGLTIASYFTSQLQHAYTKHTYQGGIFREGSRFYVYPAKQYTFTKPVYVLTTDITRSAAESFAMQMKALPNVTVVGTNTLGIISDMLGKSIGAYYLTVSNEKYVTPTGKVYEVSGVDVDTKVEVFPKQNMFHGHRDAVYKVMTLIRRKLSEERIKK